MNTDETVLTGKGLENSVGDSGPTYKQGLDQTLLSMWPLGVNRWTW